MPQDEESLWFVVSHYKGGRIDDEKDDDRMLVAHNSTTAAAFQFYFARL